MNVLIDVNIFMDVLQARQGVRSSLKVCTLLKEHNEHQGFISALTVPILYYLESQEQSDREARENVQKIIEKFEIVDLTGDIIQAAFKEGKLPDFEDCIQYHSAKVADCQSIITRNVKDFRKIELNVYIPEDFLTEMKTDSDRDEVDKLPKNKRKGIN